MVRTKQTARRGGKGFGKLPVLGTKAPKSSKLDIQTDYDRDYDPLEKDLLGEEGESDDDVYDYEREKEKEARSRGEDEDEEKEKEVAYMFFDFRRGRGLWSNNVEYIDPKRAEALLEKASAAAAEEAARQAQKKESDEESKGDAKNKSTGTDSKSYSYSANATESEETTTVEPPPESCFEVLRDGSTALIIKPGHRLKIKLSDLLLGGDANKAEREKEIEKEKKLYAKYGVKWSPDMYKTSAWNKDDEPDKKWFKDYINEYTITIDMKVTEIPPREGISLYQTALIHSDENKRTGKTTLSKSDGECIINGAGGVGIFGTYGDTTKARIDIGAWKRVVVSCKCVESKTEKGEMRTWIGTEPGIVVKEDSFSANDRFAIDPDAFYMFSSGQSTMMPGKIHVRSIRIESKFSTDQDVRSNQARDKILSMFTEERKRETDKQREGLSLASLFPKPRPMWTAPAFIGFFGDAFVENSTLEGSSNLPWSFTVLNFVLQKLVRQKLLVSEEFGLSHSARVGFSDTLHILNQSEAVFKIYLRMLKTPSESQLLSFLKKLKKILAAINTGDSLLLPLYVEGRELMLFLERLTDRSFRAIVIQTNPEPGLNNHPVTSSESFPRISYRTCMVLDNIPKKNVLDDVFWMALYNMAIHSHKGDLDRFYDVLIPFLTGKPLEASLVEAEKAFLDNAEGKSSLSNIFMQCGSWRFPQRSNTAYVRCILESLYYIYRRRGLTELQVNQVFLCIAVELVTMLENDLHFILPDENGVRVSSLALRELSSLTVNLIDEYNSIGAKEGVNFDVTFVLNEVHDLVESVNETLKYCQIEETGMPPDIDLSGPETSSLEDPALTQYKDSLSWDVTQSDPDPGQSVSLRKYLPVDFLQIPQRVFTRTEAINAIRLCDRLCTLTRNQSHCIKNDSFLILALIEHVFTQVVPIPKPRGVNMTADEVYISERAARRAERKKEEEILKAQEKKRLEDLNPKNKLKGKKKEAIAQEPINEAPAVKFYGEEELPDFEEGFVAEEKIHQLPCIWDQPITYELQVELLLTLQRLMEFLATSGFSIQQSRSLDATLIITAGSIVSISDAIIRQVADDEPSEVCCHLSGKTKEGRQLGHPGFGVSVGTFATQCETLEIHSPELNIARSSVLDYFLSPHQKRLSKIFSWEEDYNNGPGKNVIKYLRMVCREIGYTTASPHFLLVDALPMQSMLMKNYPELRCYRDIVFWWKHFLNTDRKVFPNFINPDVAAEIGQLDRMQMQLTWSWDDNRGGYMVAFSGRDLHCRPDPRQTDPITGKVIPPEQLPTHRYPSTATPSFYLPAPPIKTEDDVIYRPNLPSFEDKYGQVLNQRDSELLISYLTVPYMRLPLLITFFSSEDRIHKLQSKELRSILDSVMFEPGKYLRVDMSSVQPMMVPSPQSDLLATPFGLLMNELCRSPDTVIRSIVSLLKGALACDTGSVVDHDSTTFNTSTYIILYLARLGSRVDNYISFVIDYTTGKHDCIDRPLREMNISDETLAVLMKGLNEIRDITHGQLNPLFEDYLKRLDADIAIDPNNEKIIDRNSRLACDLHAHKLLAYRNYHEDEFSADVAKSLISSFIYLTTRHTWNKTMTTGERLQVPETELYEILQISRRRVVNWLSDSKQKIVDEVMQTALQVSSSLTGSLKVSAETLDAQNRWSKISGERSLSRWAVGSTRTVGNTDNSSDDQMGAYSLRRQLSGDKEVGEIVDNGVLGVEIDYGLGQMTLRSKHLAALTSDIASHQDVIHIFGDATIQASMIERATNMSKFRLVGLNHEIVYWPVAHSVCPPLDDQWDREYDPSDLFESEKWIASLFEPIRKNFFDGPRPPPMQFLMTEKATPADAEVVILLGLHQSLGGPWKLVYLFRRLRTVHVYECLTQAREWWFSLHLTTDIRYSLHELHPNSDERRQQYPDFWIRAGGQPYPKGVNGYLVNELDDNSPSPHASLLVIREAQHPLNLSGGQEIFVPKRFLYGILPDALLEAYDLWRDESILQTGVKPDPRAPPIFYKRLRGYPIEKDGEYMIFVEFFNHGSWEQQFVNTFNNPDIIQITGFPGRTVRVTRRLKSLVEEEFKQRQRVASILESLQLLVPPSKKKEEKSKDDTADVFKVDTAVESDYEGKGQYWPCVVRRVNDDGTYDIEYVDQYKYLGIQRNVAADLVQNRGESDKRARGEGIWHWEGMSDSEDDDWRDDSEEDNDKDDSETTVKRRIDFFQFDNLRVVLDAVSGDEDVCISILNRLGSVPGVMPFTDVFKLARVVEDTQKQTTYLGTPLPASTLKRYDADDMILVNLLYAPKRTRLHSILKVLTRIENASYICAWTKAAKSVNSLQPGHIEFGCPDLDLIELPRLKLAFSGREDHNGILRLYSVDHVDLYISNESKAISSSMLRGIPHSIILSNVRGELNVLVPVIRPFRPRIMYEPFSTFIVLDRAELAMSERYFLYPVHVSFSFLLTKGLNSAVYLMLLRFMHRVYDEVFRLADSVATDNLFSKDGLDIFKAFERCNDDWHPDAHACRLKIYLVTMDSGMKTPWDLTIQCAKYSVKLDSVSSSCRLSLTEELQILESEIIVTSSNDPKFNPEIHDEYSMALCFNRRSYLRSLLRNETSCAAKVPPRALSSNWPYYQDNTVFGQNYNSLKEVTSLDEGDSNWHNEVQGGDVTDAPVNGWLVLVVFHTLWSSGSIKVVPAVTELVAMYEDMVSFLSVRSDMVGLAEIAKNNKVTTFPTVILYRGGKEIDRVVGSERAVERVIRLLTANISDDDKVCRAKHRHRLRLEKALELGQDVDAEPVPEEVGEIDWTFDMEHCGSSYVIDNDGMRAVLAGEEEDEKTPVVWEWRNRYGGDWESFPPDVTVQLENSLMTNLFVNTYIYLPGYEIYTNGVEVKSYEIVGFTGTEYRNYNSIEVRRKGDRVIAPGEEPHVSAEQKDIDKRNAERKKDLEAYKKKMKEEMKGKDIEIIRGSVGFLPNSGIHTWKFKWNHEPAIVGKGDAIGVCSDYLEDFGVGPSPRLGGSDTGLSIGLYADGSLYYNGKLLSFYQGSRKFEPPAELVDQANAESKPAVTESNIDQSESESKTPEVDESIDSNVETKVDSKKEDIAPIGESTKLKVEPIEIAPLFGKDTIVGCQFDTNDGGTLSFFVDSVLLEGVTVTDVFKKFGGNEVFPAICVTPFPEKVVITIEQPPSEQNADGENAQEHGDEGENQEQPPPPEVLPAEDATGSVDKYAKFPSVTLLSLDEQSVESVAANNGSTIIEESSPSVTATNPDNGTTVPLDVSLNKTLPSDISSDPSTEAKIEDVTTSTVPLDSDTKIENTSDPKETVFESISEIKADDASKPAITDEDVKVVDVPIEKVRWMYELDKSAWEVYSVDQSKELETASREGKTEYKLRIGDETHDINFEKRTYQRDDGSGTDFRVRRHVVADGLAGMWEILSLRYDRPYGLSGSGVIKLLDKIWHNGESMSGHTCGLGFLFLYGLFTGDIRCKVHGSSYSGYGSKGSYGPSLPGYGNDDYADYYAAYSKSSGTSSTDSHRLALLMTQLYSDKHVKSITASIINVLGRNRQVALRMPKFKDTRKGNHSPFFNGWVDDTEPRSPVAELFGKLVPLMTTMKRKGAFVFPPPPPYSELPYPPTVVSLSLSGSESWTSPSLSDYGCDSRSLNVIDDHSIQKLMKDINFRLETKNLKPSLPLYIESSLQFDKVVKDNSHRLIIVDCFATWCGPCKTLAPVFRQISLQTPTALFLKFDVDECDELTARFEVESFPTILFIRGGSTKGDVVGTINGGGPQFISECTKLFNLHSTQEELSLLRRFHSKTFEDDEFSSASISNLTINSDQLTVLAHQPLQSVDAFVTYQTRAELGLSPVNDQLAFDVTDHDASKTAPAVSVLNRFKDDVHAFATMANSSTISKIRGLSDSVVTDFFNGSEEAEKVLQTALEGVRELKTLLEALRDSDSQMVRISIPLVSDAINSVECKSEDDLNTRNEKIRFLLNRFASRNSVIWMEFVFGALLSSKSIDDILQLNPYVPNETLSFIFNLVAVIMLRANRLGHTNRCIGTVVGLESLLKKVLKVPSESRSANGSTLIPKVIQAGEDLSKTIVMGRYYVLKSKESFVYDPRFLVFEFVWSIQLRKKQVEIVNDFRDNLARGTSKVRQMIMGAGKTSVVAPLLALILADGKSLVLSVVPKALVEMSRTRLRETFASIMVKRIYTLEFDRSTVVKASMRRGLENAAINRGVVVATPTTIKSIFLSYIENLRNLKEAHAIGIRAKIEELSAQCDELSKILALFKDGIMLLDEVDLILHPLKSELNFPIGEKFDLDGSEEGERWSLPIHLFDSIFYVSSGRISSFEQRGAALDILKKISSVVQQGYQQRHLQRLPHITLLNIDFYETTLKPLMAEWAYLWLQQQHLHGIDKAEAIQYMLEGAAAKSDIQTKINLLDMAITRVLQDRGITGPEILPTAGYIRTRTPEQRSEDAAVAVKRRSQKMEYLHDRVVLQAFLEAQEKHLKIAKATAEDHRCLVTEIYDIDEQLDEASRSNARAAGELQGSIISLHKNIETIECPRDDSLDNSVVVWYSPAFSNVSGGGTSAAGDTSVASVCGQLEDVGLTIRRCAELDEAVARARDLLQLGQLRCIVIGGDENKTGCGPSCVRYHSGKKCLRCGKLANMHSGHECPIGGRGSFSLTDNNSADSSNYLKTMKTLTDPDTPYARKFKCLPANRTSVYSAHLNVREEDRMEFWLLGTSIFDDTPSIVKWVNSLPAWVTSNPDAESESEESSTVHDKQKIDSLRSEVEVFEARKTAAAEDFDNLKRKLQQQSSEKNETLRVSVENRIAVLNTGCEALKKITEQLKTAFPHIHGEDHKGFMGPGNARDSAIALAWLETALSQLPTNVVEYSIEQVKLVWKYYYDVLNEISFLRQMALASKVVAHVTSPNHKKMLNLCYNWLSTFLPHCLAKVNRVSFGLLSAEDCRAALQADPNVPRSRLKLAVPFVGKDVPSKSSEFAHPDIVIGLSVLAYRYSGLRKDDFIDIVDSMTTEFMKEIGPARERKSSQRHEDWIYAAGGRIRGLKAHRDGMPWNIEATLSEEELSKREVVQLKFLQKSNDEQMNKLFDLIHLEPLVIHYYLQKTIFPTHMRSQRVKLSASGQSVGGDMIVGKRVGFSGTPSDLLPQELGRCDYETGDDGMMIATCLDRKIASYEVLDDSWTVEQLLEKIATTESPRYHALIDTGALITGYSNFEVAKQLLDRGLSWCDGVVFLDDDDKQQVLVRATGRVVSADQCGVSLEKRFAFYDQIHTTGMDIKHVVNAVAVITLGKDMVFRDYVQGAYRMRGIGAGQKIHVFVIPEVQELMGRELKNAVIPVPVEASDNMLERIVAWLVINSLRSEQTQWTMLCLQNISNLYRKNAYKCLHKKATFFFTAACNVDDPMSKHASIATEDTVEQEFNIDEDEEAFIENIDPNVALKVFDESIDFSLEASVPDPMPFEKRLRSMLDENDNLLLPPQHVIGHNIMTIVGQFTMIEASANRLDSEQEREQEQEQEKEVEARRDQQIEVEKYVDREYSRQEETQRPWPFSILSKPFVPSDSHPFYFLKDFKLRHHDPLEFPEMLLVSNNYFNQNWNGLRRVKNVVMVLEYAPSTTGDSLRIKTREEALLQLNEIQTKLLQKAHALFGFYGKINGREGYLSRADLINAITSSTDSIPSEELLDKIFSEYSSDGKYLNYEAFKSLLTSGLLFPEHIGRHWVAVSLAEAETIRRILHVRSSKGLNELIPGSQTEMALRYSPLSTPTSNIPGGDGGMIFDVSRKWYKNGTNATSYEASVAHSCFRFFDCDMHFSTASLNILVRVLRGSRKDRERFFLSTIGCKRRMDRKWQDTPLAKVFMIADQWVALKQQAQSVYINEALRAKGLTLWEAFTSIDSDNNGILSPSEVYGALLWLQSPGITAEDVVDFIEAADKNRDGMIDYREYIEILTDTVDKKNITDTEDDEQSEREPIVEKVEPYGADELREIMVARKQKEQALLREERLRKQAYKEALDIKIFEEELEASRSRKGGANPLITTSNESNLIPGVSLRTTDYKFTSNELPLRFTPSGKSYFMVLFQDTAADPKIIPFKCRNKHELSRYRYYWMRCDKCNATDTAWICWNCYIYYCNGCYEGYRKSQEHDRRDVTKLPTCLRCNTTSNFTLQIPSTGGANTITGQFTITMEIRLSKLPAAGQWQSLLRFSVPDPTNQARKLHRASALINHDGLIVNDITADIPSDSELGPAPRLRSGVWFVVTLTVDPGNGTFTTYVNGKKLLSQTGLDSADLRLQNKIIVYGGGTQAQCRGGDIRRLVIHDQCFTDEIIEKLYFQVGDENPAIGGRAVKIQSIYRGFITRLKNKPLKESNGVGKEKKVEENKAAKDTSDDDY